MLLTVLFVCIGVYSWFPLSFVEDIANGLAGLVEFAVASWIWDGASPVATATRTATG